MTCGFLHLFWTFYSIFFWIKSIEIFPNRTKIFFLIRSFFSFLGLSCSANSSYSSSMSTCPASCANLAAPSECDVSFLMEGCKCAPGFVMSQASCVPYTECGCNYLNRYYPVSESTQSGHWVMTEHHFILLSLISLCVTLQLGEIFVTEDCSETCECTSTGVVCKPKTCQENYVCTIYDTRRDCFKGLQFVFQRDWIFSPQINHLVNKTFDLIFDFSKIQTVKTHANVQNLRICMHSNQQLLPVALYSCMVLLKYN